MLMSVYAFELPTNLLASSDRVTIEVCAHDVDAEAEAEIKNRINSMNGLVDMKFTPEVMSYIQGYLKYKQGASSVLGRQNIYFPMFEQALTEKEMPTDLKYLSIVESALKPNAVSRAGAAGLWQLMRGTGRMLGLKINSVVDERRNPYKSTQAALDYLNMLHEEFGDWTLALAAYNSGPGRVRRAISLGNSEDFWEIKKYLPKETRNYVPAFIAVNYIVNYYYLHDIQPSLEHPDFMSVSNITLYDKISFQEISEITGTDVNVIKQLNPCYLRAYVPGGSLGSHVMLPNYAATLLLNHLYRPDNPNQEISVMLLDNRVISNNDLHLVRPQDAVVDFLPSATLQMLKKSEDELAVVLNMSGRNEEDIVWYRLKKRESLMDIAKRKNLSFERLLELNSGWSQDWNPGSMIRIQ